MRPSELDPERWRRIDAIFDLALDTPPDRLDEFLTGACDGDEALRSEVEALLKAHARGGSRFEEPVSPMGAAILSAAEPGPEDRRVGPFRLLREIGRGGMGVVYLAEDTRLGRHVALKALPPYLGVGPEAKRRFMAEARAVSALDHPNIATLFEIDETEEGQLYMVFAFYAGETLASHIARGPLPVEDSVEIATRIADGLAAAHGRGIIHRDVKPSNVLLTEGGDVKLLDFGVAKVAGEELTGEGVRVGTVAYMSPEQADGGSLDPRTDLWSLGVVLYEMLTGERPFRGADPSSLLHSIRHDVPPRAGSLRSEVPEALSPVVEKLLSKEPEGRYQSAEDLLADLGAVQAGAPPSLAIGGASSRRRNRRRTRAGPVRRRVWQRVSTSLIGLAVVVGGVWIAANAFRAGGERIERLAVLPLENLTGDSAQQYFIDGVHDELIAELGKLGTVSVISRTSVMRYRDTKMTVPEIARQLDVDAVVEGSVFRQGDSLAVTTQLVAASPERQLWAETYRRGVGNVFVIGSEVARSIARQIESNPGPAAETRLTAARPVNAAAYDAYTLGQFNIERRNAEGFGLAEKYLRRAIEIDSTFAPAYAALGSAYGSAAFFGLARPAETMPRVRELAERALAIDSTLPEAHALLGAVRLYWNWDWTGAEAEMRRAIAINPSDAGAHRLLSEVLSATGHYREALSEVERGSELERLVPFSAFRPAVVLEYMGDYDRAIEQIREGLKFFTDFWQGHWLLCQALAARELYAEATPECEAAVQLSHRTPMALGSLGRVYGSSGRTAQAKRLAAELEERAKAQYVNASSIAAVYVGLGDRDRAFQWLDKACEERDVVLVHLRDSFDSLHSDPRFDALLRKIGLEPRTPSGGAG